MESNKNPSEDFVEIGSSLLKGDILKIYYLMILTGTPPAYANQFLFNLRFSDQRANAIKIRNTLIRSLKQTLLKIVNDPVLYQRARALANRKDFNVFEEIEKELTTSLDEVSVSQTLKRLTSLNNNKDYKKQIANYILNFTEELQGTIGTQLGQVQGTGTTGGIDSYDLPLGSKKKRNKTMITRRGKMVGNPLFALTNEGYSLAVNGQLPPEINEALEQTGIVVLENSENESMMFLVSEPESKEQSDQSEDLDEAKTKLDPVGQEDDDIDNDGKKNTKEDKYLKQRRKAVSAAIQMKHKKKVNEENSVKEKLKGLKADYEKHADEIRKPIPPVRGSKNPMARVGKGGKMEWAKDRRKESGKGTRRSGDVDYRSTTTSE